MTVRFAPPDPAPQPYRQHAGSKVIFPRGMFTDEPAMPIIVCLGFPAKR